MAFCFPTNNVKLSSSEYSKRKSNSEQYKYVRKNIINGIPPQIGNKYGSVNYSLNTLSPGGKITSVFDYQTLYNIIQGQYLCSPCKPMQPITGSKSLPSNTRIVLLDDKIYLLDLSTQYYITAPNICPPNWKVNTVENKVLPISNLVQSIIKNYESKVDTTTHYHHVIDPYHKIYTKRCETSNLPPWIDLIKKASLNATFNVKKKNYINTLNNYSVTELREIN